jgi:hypothetical protein
MLYDRFATYAPAFAAGVGASAINLAIIGTLVVRFRSFANESAAQMMRTSESGH